MEKEQAKELVFKIFGKEASEDDDIVDFYYETNKLALESSNNPPTTTVNIEEKMREEFEKLWKELDPEQKRTAGERGTAYGYFLHGWMGKTNKGFWQRESSPKEDAKPCGQCGSTGWQNGFRCVCNFAKEEKQESDKYKYCNHHHELSDKHELVDFGDGKFIANKQAIPLLKALNEIGLKTRSHHIDSTENAWICILLDNVKYEEREVFEKDADRDKYNGKKELLIEWIKSSKSERTIGKTTNYLQKQGQQPEVTLTVSKGESKTSCEVKGKMHMLCNDSLVCDSCGTDLELIDTIFNTSAIKAMKKWDLEKFKHSHRSLWFAIRRAMELYASSKQTSSKDIEKITQKEITSEDVEKFMETHCRHCYGPDPCNCWNDE